MFRRMIITSCILICFTGFSALFMILMNRFLNDNSLPSVEISELDKSSSKVMVILARPDDQIYVAGTLSLFNDHKIDTKLISFTKGEVGSSEGYEEIVDLGAERLRETEDVAAILGIDHLQIMNFVDRELHKVQRTELIKEIELSILSFRPSIVITYDEIGIYGNNDNVITSNVVKEVIMKNMNNKNFPVSKLFGITLSDSMKAIAIKLSPNFCNNISLLSNPNLPTPDFYISIYKSHSQKEKAILGYKTRRHIFNTVFPFHEIVPSFAYFKVIDKEYFQTLLVSEDNIE